MSAVNNTLLNSTSINSTLINNSPSIYFRFVMFAEDLIINIISNFHILIILTLFIYAIGKIYASSKERFEELNLFNIDKMSEEEKKLYYFTRKLTYINEKNSGKFAESAANQGKLNINKSVYELNNDYNKTNFFYYSVQ